MPDFGAIFELNLQRAAMGVQLVFSRKQFPRHVHSAKWGHSSRPRFKCKRVVDLKETMLPKHSFYCNSLYDKEDFCLGTQALRKKFVTHLLRSSRISPPRHFSSSLARSFSFLARDLCRSYGWSDLHFGLGDITWTRQLTWLDHRGELGIVKILSKSDWIVAYSNMKIEHISCPP